MGKILSNQLNETNSYALVKNPIQNAITVTNDEKERIKQMTTGGKNSDPNSSDQSKLKIKNINSNFKVGVIDRMSNNLKVTREQNVRKNSNVDGDKSLIQKQSPRKEQYMKEAKELNHLNDI